MPVPSLPRSQRRAGHRCRRWCSPGVDRLESRPLSSAYYDLSSVAWTPEDPFTSFGDLVAINNSGTVAFVGNNTPESGLWIDDPTRGLVNVNPIYTTDQTITRTFGRAVAINNAGVITATDHVTSGNGLVYTREWLPGTPDEHIDLASAPGGFTDFGSLQTFTAINDSGQAAFVGLSSGGSFRYIETESPSIDLGVPETVGGASAFAPAPGGGVVPNSSPRPQLTADGRVLIYNPGFVTLALNTSLSQGEVIASAAQGFQWIGNNPGVSADGRIVVFTGDRGNGPGLFASYAAGGSSRTIIRLAGEGKDGFTNFNPLDAVRVNNTEATERGATVVFMGTSNLGTGIYTTRISFFGDSATDFDPDDPAAAQVSGASPVALLGDVVHPATELTPAKTIVNLSLWDGINDINRGEVAFWAGLSDNSQEIFKAEPRPVVWIDFNPTTFSPPGLTKPNLALLQQVGIGNLGWRGGFLDSVAALGYTADPLGFESQIVAAVQSYYTAAGSNVRVLGAPGDTMPAFVPYTVTDSSGNVAKASDGNPLTRGVFQTVYVGWGPDNGGTDLGLASPLYAAAGGLDYYNQIPDDTAVVFSDRIFNPVNTGAPIGMLAQDVRVRAVASVIAHEAGHNFGLFHLDPSQSQLLMTGGFTEGEFNGPRSFNLAPAPVEEYKPELAGVSESSVLRLAFTTGSTMHTGVPPDPALLAINDAAIRKQIGAQLTGPPVTVKDLVVGIISTTVDTLPQFIDLGGGDLATLLSSASILASPLDNLIILGSTTGTSLDIVIAPDTATAGSVSASALGVATDSRLAIPGTLAAGAGPWHVFQFGAQGPVDLGTFTGSDASLFPPLVATPVPDQVVTEATGSIEVDLAVTPAATADDPYLYALAPGAPAGTFLMNNATAGSVIFSPESNLPPGTYPVTVNITDSDASHARTTSVTFLVVVKNTVNEPPQLDPIGNRVAQAGDTVTFTARATDPDLPQDTLTYSLDPGAPAGASIEAATGAFSWPSCDASPGTYQVTVRVSDSGTPALSATQTVTITLVPQAQLRPGDPIPEFGTDGETQTDVTVPTEDLLFNKASTPQVVLVQPDGKIVVSVVTNTAPALVRLLPDGTLDPAFGQRGRMTYDFATLTPSLQTRFTLAGAVLLPGGGIEIAGTLVRVLGTSPDALSTVASIALVRINAAGAVDPTFGKGGVVITNLGDATTASQALGLALRPDGDVVVTGSLHPSSGAAMPAVVAYRSDGTLDPGFANGGALIFDRSNPITSLTQIAAQADNRVVLAGVEPVAGASPDQTELVAIRLNPDGSPDTSFGTRGSALFSSGSGNTDSAAGLAIAPGQKIVLLDSGSDTTFIPVVDVIRFDPDGSPDPGFGTLGVAPVSVATTAATGLAVARNGQVAVGLFHSGGYLPAVVALTPAGSVDLSFGSQGEADFAFGGMPAAPLFGALNALVFQPDGALIAVGASTGASSAAVARLDAHGALDASFGAGGRTVTDFLVPGPFAGAPTVVGQPDGSLLVAMADVSGGIRAFHPDGSPDPSFGDDGVLYPAVNPLSTISGFAVLPHGKILIVGSDGAASESTPLIARVLPDGSLDLTFGSGGMATFVNPYGLTSGTPQSVVIQGDGKILLGLDGGLVLRLDADGTVDNGFGTDGVALISPPSAGAQQVYVALLPDGKILATFQQRAPLEYETLVRLNPDGTLDTSFGTGGTVTTRAFVDPVGLVVQSDGKFLESDIHVRPDDGTSLAVSRYNADGTRDTSFGTGGTAFADAGNFSVTSAFTLAGDGSILVAGIADLAGKDHLPLALAIARFLPDGTLDPAFGSGGIAMRAFDPAVPTSSVMVVLSNLVVAPDSRSVYVAGLTLGNRLVVAGDYLYPPLPAPGVVQFMASQAAVDESTGMATVMVCRTGGSAGTVTVNYSTSGGTAQAGVAYTAESGTLTLAPGQSAASFSVPILDNQGLADGSNINLTLSTPAGGAAIGAVGTEVLTIHAPAGSSTGAKPGILRFDSAAISASESDESAVVAVDRVGGSDGTVTVPYAVTGGTASAGVDYEATSGVLTFGPGVTRLAFVVPLIHDAASQADTSAQLVLGAPQGGATLGDQNTATLTILDIDAPGQIAPGPAPAPVAANQGFAAVTITRSAGLGRSVAITYATADGTAVAGRDYTAVHGTLAFPAGVASQTVMIPLAPDLALGQPISFQVELSSPTGGVELSASAAVPVTLVPPPPLPPSSSYPPGPSSPTPTPPALLSSTPANDAVLAALPTQLVLTFSQHLANQTDGGPAVPGDPHAVFWVDVSVQIPVTTVYHALANGTSTITITPAYPSSVPAFGLQVVQIDLTAFVNAGGLRLTAPNGGFIDLNVLPPGTGPGGPQPGPPPPQGGTGNGNSGGASSVAPRVTATSTTQLHKGRVNKGTSTITIDFSEPLAPSAGASSLYALGIPTRVHKHNRVTTVVVASPFSAALTGPSRVTLTLLKPTKQHLTLVIHAALTSAGGATLGHDLTINL